MTKLLEEAIFEIRKLTEFEQNHIATMLLYQLKSTKNIKGVSGKNLIKFAGKISEEDLQLMNEAIIEDCEKVDINEW